MRVAALQFDVRRGEAAHNLGAVEGGLRAARERGVELVVLPEMWPTSFPGANPDFEALLAATEHADARVAALSRELGLAVCGSGFGRVAGADRPSNRWSLFERGEVLARYDKVHLFSPTAEPECFSAGDAPPPTVELRGARIGGFVCYDLRFPELVRRCFDDGAQLLCIPAQWPAPRATHFRALAVGCAALQQCFVVACNRTGRESIGRRGLELVFPGNSLVADPGGVVLAEGRGEDGLVVADVDLAAARELRRSVPVARDSRPEVYASWKRGGA